MTDTSEQRVLEFRYGLYSRAYEALLQRVGANGMLRLHSQALGCRRAADVIELAELHVENGFPRLDAEHLVAQVGDCADCGRASCLLPDEIEEAAPDGAASKPRRQARGGWNAA
jgi:hypothetical protein